jgi:hypothetical protein
MGSHPQDDDAVDDDGDGDVAPQHELPPDLARSAACPYFSFTTSLMLCSAMKILLFAALRDLPGLQRFVSRAALGI